MINNSNINPKYDCNKSGVHLNWKGTDELIENFLFALNKLNSRRKTLVGMRNSYNKKLVKSQSQKKSDDKPLKTCKTRKENT